MKKGIRLSGLAQKKLTALRASWGGTRGSIIKRVILEATPDRGLPEKKGFTFSLPKDACEKLSRLCQSFGMTETEMMSVLLDRATRERKIPTKPKIAAPNLGKKYIQGGRT